MVRVDLPSIESFSRVTRPRCVQFGKTRILPLGPRYCCRCKSAWTFALIDTREKGCSPWGLVSNRSLWIPYSSPHLCCAPIWKCRSWGSKSTWLHLNRSGDTVGEKKLVTAEALIRLKPFPPIYINGNSVNPFLPPSEKQQKKGHVIFFFF